MINTIDKDKLQLAWSKWQLENPSITESWTAEDLANYYSAFKFATESCLSEFEQVVYADEDNLNIAPNIKPRYTFFVSTEKTYPFDTPLFTRKG